MFRNKYHVHDTETHFTDPGSPMKVEYEGKYDKDKNLVVVPKGETNLAAYINSFADSCDINVLLKRFQQGDTEALMEKAGAYCDVSNVPSSFQEMVDISLAAKNAYNILPAEIKLKFDNNVNKYISMMNTEEWKEIMNTSEDELNRAAVKAAVQNSKTNKELVKKPIENPAVDAESPKEDIN